MRTLAIIFAMNAAEIIEECLKICKTSSADILYIIRLFKQIIIMAMK